MSDGFGHSCPDFRNWSIAIAEATGRSLRGFEHLQLDIQSYEFAVETPREVASNGKVVLTRVSIFSIPDLSSGYNWLNEARIQWEPSRDALENVEDEEEDFEDADPAELSIDTLFVAAKKRLPNNQPPIWLGSLRKASRIARKLPHPVEWRVARVSLSWAAMPEHPDHTAYLSLEGDDLRKFHETTSWSAPEPVSDLQLQPFRTALRREGLIDS